MNIYASEYVQKVNDFNRTVIARGADGWVVKSGEALRELRVPASLGYPDLAASRGITGFQTRGNERYVTSPRARQRCASPPNRRRSRTSWTRTAASRLREDGRLGAVRAALVHAAQVFAG
jgi:hypothetical protein